MPPDATTRRLRNLVAELATLDKADTEDILSQLPVEHRGRVEDLLAAYAMSGEIGSVEEEPQVPVANLIFSYVDLSPWLTERLANPRDEFQVSPLPKRPDRRDQAKASPRIALTPLASDVLRECAEPFLDNSPLAAPDEATDAQTWIRRFGTRLLGGGRRS